MERFVIILGLLGIVVVMLAVYIAIFGPIEEKEQKKREEKEESENAYLEKYLSENNVNITAEYHFKSSDDKLRCDFYVDDKNRRIHIGSNEVWMNVESYSYDQVLGFEIEENSQIVGRVGRAIAGGIVAGDVGAVVGAATAKKGLTNYSINFYTTDIEYPRDEYTLIEKEKPLDMENIDVIKAKAFAKDVNDTIRVILEKMKSENRER